MDSCPRRASNSRRVNLNRDLYGNLPGTYHVNHTVSDAQILGVDTI